MSHRIQKSNTMRILGSKNSEYNKKLTKQDMNLLRKQISEKTKPELLLDRKFSIQLKLMLGCSLRQKVLMTFASNVAK